MEYGQFIDALNSDWVTKRVALTKGEVSYIGSKDSFKHRLIGFMTASYYKRSSLIHHSEIQWGYVFQDWTNEVRKEVNDYPTWVLFSPEKKIAHNPLRLREVLETTHAVLAKDTLLSDEKKLKKLIGEYLSDCAYFELPSSCTGGDLVYLSIVYRPIHLVPTFYLGLNLFLTSATTSKEILYLPERYWPSAYKKAYLNKEFLL